MTARRKVRRRASAPAVAKKGGAKNGAGESPRAPDPSRPLAEQLRDRPPPTTADREKVATAFRAYVCAVWMENPRTERVGGRVQNRLPPVTVTLPDRVGITENAMAYLDLERWERVSPRDGAHWLPTGLLVGPAAIADAMAEMVETPDLSTLPTGVLSALGNAVSRAFRRRVLLEVLKSTGGNLAKASTILGMGEGSANVARAVRELDLEAELEQIRVASKATR